MYQNKIKIKLKPRKSFKIVDLFAGTGAFTHALTHTSNCFQSVFANDIVESSRQIYQLNHPHTHFLLEDLNNVDVSKIPSHDVLCGGFPCQPFSIAGKQLGFDDIRSNVFWKILEILKYHKSPTIILENVKNLTSHDNGNTYRTIKTHLSQLGYWLHAAILDTSTITSVPQHRERIYMIGFLDKNQYEKFSLSFPSVQNRPIKDFLEPNIDDKYYYTDKLKVYDEIKLSVIKDIETNTVYQYRRHYVRENKSGCCPTLTANMGGGGHNVPIILDSKGIRKLTPRECFNLQGFDSSYQLPKLSDSSLYKLAGNAVSVPVVRLIADRLSQIL